MEARWISRAAAAAAVVAAVAVIEACPAPRVTPPRVQVPPDVDEGASLPPSVMGEPGATPAPRDASAPAPAPGAPPLSDASVAPELHLVLDDLVFAVVGDTRPPYPDDTRGYPTAIIREIWGAVQKESPHPRFAVGTGDYVFATSFGRQAAPQLDLYLDARRAFDGPVYYAMGNHECTGLTASNCGHDAADRAPRPYVAFLTRMLAPMGVSTPWYSVRADAKDGSWSARFVFIAPNAWNEDQEEWLEETLARTDTTYTFAVRHEGAHWMMAPGVRPSNHILESHPPTLSLVGHVHTYRRSAGGRELVVGNGGAPLSGSAGYGYVIARRRPSDGAIEFTARKLPEGDVVDRFAVNADGSSAPLH